MRHFFTFCFYFLDNNNELAKTTVKSFYISLFLLVIVFEGDYEDIFHLTVRSIVVSSIIIESGLRLC